MLGFSISTSFGRLSANTIILITATPRISNPAETMRFFLILTRGLSVETCGTFEFPALTGAINRYPFLGIVWINVGGFSESPSASRNLPIDLVRASYPTTIPGQTCSSSCIRLSTSPGRLAKNCRRSITLGSSLTTVSPRAISQAPARTSQSAT